MFLRVCRFVLVMRCAWFAAMAAWTHVSHPLHTECRGPGADIRLTFWFKAGVPARAPQSGAIASLAAGDRQELHRALEERFAAGVPLLMMLLAVSKFVLCSQLGLHATWCAVPKCSNCAEFCRLPADGGRLSFHPCSRSLRIFFITSTSTAGPTTTVGAIIMLMNTRNDHRTSTNHMQNQNQTLSLSLPLSLSLSPSLCVYPGHEDGHGYKGEEQQQQL